MLCRLNNMHNAMQDIRVQISVDTDLPLTLPCRPPSPIPSPDRAWAVGGRYQPEAYPFLDPSCCTLLSPVSDVAPQSVSFQTEATVPQTYSGPLSECTLRLDYYDRHHWGFESDPSIASGTELENYLDILPTESEPDGHTETSPPESEEPWNGRWDLFDNSD
ncbi:hypothetical protein ACF0H5_003437 [Mactra antiquata]